MTSTISRFVALIMGVLTLGGTARADFFVGNPTVTGSGLRSRRPMGLRVLTRSISACWSRIRSGGFLPVAKGMRRDWSIG